MIEEAYRAQLEGNRAKLAEQLDTLRGHTQQAFRKLLELEEVDTDPELLAFAQEAAGMLEDRCRALSRAITAIDEELEEE